MSIGVHWRALQRLVKTLFFPMPHNTVQCDAMWCNQFQWCFEKSIKFCKGIGQEHWSELEGTAESIKTLFFSMSQNTVQCDAMWCNQVQWGFEKSIKSRWYMTEEHWGALEGTAETSMPYNTVQCDAMWCNQIQWAFEKSIKYFK